MYRVLSLDGGGIKGLFIASFLAEIEQSIGKSISDYFDLIAGTSTGGIIAIGLGLGYSATDLAAFYRHLGPRVFAGNKWKSGIRRIVIGKYDPRPLREALLEKFGDKCLGNSKNRLLIPTLNLDTGEVYIYKSAHHPRFEKDFRKSAVDAAMQTAAAPTYFPPHPSESGIPLVDGGTWANNPIGFAVVEAIAALQWPLNEIKVLSIGCPAAPLDVGRKWQFGWGILSWARRITDVFMAGQSSSSLGIAQSLLGHQNVVRIERSVPHGRYSMDGLKNLKSLNGLGEAEGRIWLPRLRADFFHATAAPFVPFHQL